MLLLKILPPKFLSEILLVFFLLGNEEASKILSQALELDQDEPEWHHLKGKVW